MIATEPVLNVLLYSALAAAVAALGALPFTRGGTPRPIWIGGASALAAGLMLGAGYLLIDRGLEHNAWIALTGGAAGVLYTLGARAFSGLDDLEPLDETSDDLSSEMPDSGSRVLLQHGLHAAAEGVAIGVAMTLELRLGIFVALALAVHNIGEAMALTGELRQRGISAGRAARLAVAINLPQPVLALAAFALGPALAALLPGALGFAAGALVFLVLTELIPEAYQRSSQALVALLVSGTAAAVILFESFFLGASVGAGP